MQLLSRDPADHVLRFLCDVAAAITASVAVSPLVAVVDA